MIELPERIRHFALAHSLHLATKVRQDRYGGQSGKPLPKALDFRGDQFLSRRQLVAAALEIGRYHRAQIVEIVEEDVVERADTLLDVTRHRDVENAERSIPASGHRRSHAIERYYRPRRRCRAEQYIDLVQRRPALVVMHRERAMPARELLRALVRAIGDHCGADALVDQTLQRELGHLAGAEHHGASSRERSEDLSG